MVKIIWHTLVNILGLYLISFLFPLVVINNLPAAILAGFLLSLLFITIRPLLLVLSLPLSLLSFGSFVLIINTWMLQLTDLMVGGLYIPNFGTTFIASTVIMLLNFLVRRCTKDWQHQTLPA